MKKTFYLCAILALVVSLSACTSKNSKENDSSKPADKIETLSNNKSSEGDEDWEKAADNLEKARMEAKNSRLIQQFVPSSVIRLYCAN